MRGAKRKIPWRRRSTDRMSQARRWAKVRPGCWPAANLPCLERRRRGERSGEGGGDGVDWPLLGILLYGCIATLFYVIWALPLSLSLSLSLSLDSRFPERESWKKEVEWCGVYEGSEREGRGMHVGITWRGWNENGWMAGWRRCLLFWTQVLNSRKEFSFLFMASHVGWWAVVGLILGLFGPSHSFLLPPSVDA